MKTKFKLVMTLVVVGLLAGALAAYGSVSARGNSAVSGNVPVMDFQDHGGVFVMNAQERGTSDLVRSVDGIAMNVDTTDLPVGAYTVWWIIFNNPTACSDGVCGEDDVLPPPGTPEAGVSPVWATGGLVGPDRKGHFSARLGVGLDAAPGAVLWGDGLTNPMGAVVRIAVRYQGPTAWDDLDLLAQQLTNIGGNCAAFGCYTPQVAAHTP